MKNQQETKRWPIEDSPATTPKLHPHLPHHLHHQPACGVGWRHLRAQPSSGNQSSHDTSTRHHPPANRTISFVSLQRWKAKSTVWTEGGDTAAHKTTSPAIQSPAVKALPETSHLRLRNGRLLRAHKLSQPPVAVWARQIPKQGSVLGSRGRSDRVNPKPLRASPQSSHLPALSQP